MSKIPFYLGPVMLASLLLTSSAAEQATGIGAGNWDRLLKRCQEIGMSAGNVSSIRRTCARSTLLTKDVDRIVSLVLSAGDGPATVGMMVERIAEGLSKNASAGDIVQALETRRESLAAARLLLADSLPDGACESDLVIRATTHALESRVATETVEKILKGLPAEAHSRIEMFIGAAELLSLAGLAPEDVEALVMRSITEQLDEQALEQLVAISVAQHREQQERTTEGQRRERVDRHPGVLETRTRLRAGRLFGDDVTGARPVVPGQAQAAQQGGEGAVHETDRLSRDDETVETARFRNARRAAGESDLTSGGTAYGETDKTNRGQGADKESRAQNEKQASGKGQSLGQGQEKATESRSQKEKRTSS